MTDLSFEADDGAKLSVWGSLNIVNNDDRAALEAHLREQRARPEGRITAIGRAARTGSCSPARADPIGFFYKRYAVLASQ